MKYTRKQSKFRLNLVFFLESETPQNDPFYIHRGQTVSGKIGQQGENIDQSGTVNNDDGVYYEREARVNDPGRGSPDEELYEF